MARCVLGETGGNGFTGWWKCSQMFSGYGCTAFWIYKNHWIIYIQWVNHLVYELYFKKAIIKKKQKRSMGWNVLELNGWELSVFLTLKSMNWIGTMMLSSGNVWGKLYKATQKQDSPSSCYIQQMPLWALDVSILQFFNSRPPRPKSP